MEDDSAVRQRTTHEGVERPEIQLVPKHKTWVEHDPTEYRFDPKKISLENKSSQRGKRQKSETDDEVTTILQSIYSEINPEV